MRVKSGDETPVDGDAYEREHGLFNSRMERVCTGVPLPVGGSLT